MNMSKDHDNPEREKQVVELLRAAARTERAPDSLHARVAAMRDEAASAPKRRLLPRPGMLPRPGVRPRPGVLPRPAALLARVAMPIAAAVAAVIVLTLGGGAGAPSIAQAAALATRAPTASAPATDPRDPGKLLTAKVGTLHFPNWASTAGWRAVGQRHDQLGNRTATTVYYTAGSRRVVYSILSSPTLSIKHALVSPARPAYTYATLSRSGRTTVIWQEAGHTCLLTGSRGMTVPQLTWLAFSGFRQPLA